MARHGLHPDSCPKPLRPLGRTGNVEVLWNLLYSRHSPGIPRLVSQPDPGFNLLLTLTKGPVSQDMELAKDPQRARCLAPNPRKD